MSAAHFPSSYFPARKQRQYGVGPSTSNKSTDARPLSRGAHSVPWWVMLVASVIAFGTSSYLAWSSFTASPVAGCDGGAVFNCEHVLHSRWSTVLSIPVSVPAMALYAMVISLLFWKPASERAERVRGSVLGLASLSAGAAAIWFIGLQIFSLNHLCPYCLVAHACSIALAATFLFSRPIGWTSMRWIVGTAAFSLASLIALQSLNSEPETFEVIEYPDAVPTLFGAPDATQTEEQEATLFEAPVAFLDTRPNQLLGDLYNELNVILGVLVNPATLLTAEVTAPPSQRHTARILNGVELNTATWPLLGKPDAEKVLVEMFDYTCEHCQRTHVALEGVRKQFGDRLAIITLPVPLDGKCNPTVQSTHASHREACELAKLAVAVWITDRNQFEGFHNYLFDAKPGYAQAMVKAKSLVDGQKLDETLRGTLPSEYINKHIALYQKAGSGTIPKFLFPKATTVGAIETPDAMTRLINQHLPQ